MRYRQRPSPPSGEPAGPWSPSVTRADGSEVEMAPRPGDTYVVVDEIIDVDVRLVGAPWPRMDEAQRLVFEDPGRELAPVFPQDALTAAIDRHRAAEGQVTRALRVGDAFLVRGRADDPERWELAVDVTQAARRAAKLAQKRAIAPPTADRERAAGRSRRELRARRGMPGPEGSKRPPGRPVPGSTASPVV